MLDGVLRRRSNALWDGDFPSKCLLVNDRVWRLAADRRGGRVYSQTCRVRGRDWRGVDTERRVLADFERYSGFDMVFMRVKVDRSVCDGASVRPHENAIDRSCKRRSEIAPRGICGPTCRTRRI